jgi:hypothetical protein
VFLFWPETVKRGEASRLALSVLSLSTLLLATRVAPGPPHSRKTEEAAITQVQMTNNLQPADGTRYSLALVRKNEDGTASIVFGTNNPAAVNSVLTIAGKTLKERAANEAEQNAAKHDAEQRAENADRVAQELLANGQFQPAMQADTITTETVTA